MSNKESLCDFLIDRQNLFHEIVSGVLSAGVFFFVEITVIVSSLGGQKDVQCSRVHLLAERNRSNM